MRYERAGQACISTEISKRSIYTYIYEYVDIRVRETHVSPKLVISLCGSQIVANQEIPGQIGLDLLLILLLDKRQAPDCSGLNCDFFLE